MDQVHLAEKFREQDGGFDLRIFNVSISSMSICFLFEFSSDVAWGFQVVVFICLAGKYILVNQRNNIGVLRFLYVVFTGNK